MVRYQIDTFRYAALIHIQKRVGCYAVTEQSRATSFFIFCITRLWGSVGNFLGRRAQTEETLPAGRFLSADAIQHVGDVQTVQILARKLKC